MGDLIFTLLVAGGMFGAFGALIANNKGVDGTTGFLLGAFLGPIGCLIVAFLTPQQPQASLEKSTSNDGLPVQSVPPKSRNLENAQYRIWLVREYAIERNDVLGEVICGEKSFKTMDDALRFADAIERKKVEEKEAAAAESKAQLAAEVAALGITFDGELYHYKSYKYQSLSDAIAYARLGKE